MNIVAKVGVWPKLQELLGDNFHPWLNSVEENMSKYEFMFYRRKSDKIYLVPVVDDYEAVLNVRKDKSKCFETVWKHDDLGFNSLNQSDKWLLRLMTQYIDFERSSK